MMKDVLLKTIAPLLLTAVCALGGDGANDNQQPDNRQPPPGGGGGAPDPFTDPKTQEDTGLDKGYIIIIVIAACMVILGGLFVAIFWICWRRKRKMLEREQEEAFRQRALITQQRTLDRVTSLETRSSVVSDIRVQKKQAADYWSGRPIASDPAVEVKEDMKLPDLKDDNQSGKSQNGQSFESESLSQSPKPDDRADNITIDSKSVEEEVVQEDVDRRISPLRSTRTAHNSSAPLLRRRASCSPRTSKNTVRDADDIDRMYDPRARLMGFGRSVGGSASDLQRLNGSRKTVEPEVPWDFQLKPMIPIPPKGFFPNDPRYTAPVHEFQSVMVADGGDHHGEMAYVIGLPKFENKIIESILFFL